MIASIYKATNKINGKVYIGQTTKTLHERIINHKSESNTRKQLKFHKAIAKYGFENFEWEVIDQDELGLGILDELEKLHISRYMSCNPNYGYNETNGGKGPSGRKLSAKSREKLSLANKGRIFTEKHKNNLRLAKIGIKESKQTIKNKSKRMQGQSLFGFVGAQLNKSKNPEKKCWRSRIKLNKKNYSLFMYEDPLSASIVYDLVWNEIYG